MRRKRIYVLKQSRPKYHVKIAESYFNGKEGEERDAMCRDLMEKIESFFQSDTHRCIISEAEDINILNLNTMRKIRFLRRKP